MAEERTKQSKSQRLVENPQSKTARTLPVLRNQWKYADAQLLSQDCYAANLQMDKQKEPKAKYVLERVYRVSGQISTTNTQDIS